MFHQVGRIGSRLAIPFKRRNARLWLDFTSGNQKLDSRITFSRASNATVVGKDGTIQYAPHNLLTYSEQFDNAAWPAWLKANATVTANAATAPDGTATADTITDSSDASKAVHTVQAPAAFASGVVYTVSVHVKAGTLPGAAILFPSAAFAGNIQAMFNVATGVVESVDTGVTASIVPLPNGWYRCVATATATASATSNIQLRLATATTMFYQGTGAGTVFLWGTQLNVGALQPYYPTTVKNLLGFTQEFDNAAWTKSNSLVQTNQIRNNTMQGAVAGTPGTTPTNWTAASTTNGISREIVGVGMEDGINYIDIRFYGTPVTGSQYVDVSLDNSVAATVGQAWTLSAYLRLLSGSMLGTAPSLLLYETPSFVNTSGSINTVTSAPLKTQRLTVSRTLSGGATAGLSPRIGWTIPAATLVDFTLRIGMPQLVQGAVAGDVVATYGTAKAIGYQAPDGSVTAQKLVESTTNGQQVFYVFTSTIGPSTLSIHAKAAGRRWLNLRHQGLSAFFDLGDGTVGSVDAGLVASIVALGNGWYRCSAYKAAAGSGAAGGRIATANNNDSYQGDGTSGIYIWGAQLSDSASLDPYVYNPGAAPSASAYYGPRFDYDPVTLQPKGLLIEEQRTNLLFPSESFSTTTGSVVTNGVATSPFGTQSATTVVEDTSVGNHAAQSAAATFSAVAATISVYAKAAGRNWILIRLQGTNRAYFNIANGTLGTVDASATASITNVGNGWYRCSITVTPTAGAANVFVRLATADGGDSYTGNGTSGALLFGVQAEAGSFATSYIPTTTASATRAADVAVMTGANFSNWYRQDEGTLYADVTSVGTSGYIYTVMRSGVGYGPRIQTTLNGVNTSYLAVVDDGGSVVVSVTRAGLRSAAAIKTDDYVLVANGGAPITDTTGPLPTLLAQLRIGHDSVGTTQLNGTIKRLAFFPRRLQNAELQGITS